MTDDKKAITIPLNITTLLVGLLIVAAFVIGSLWTRLQMGSNVKGAQQKQQAAQPNNNPPAEPSYREAGDVEGLRDNDHAKGDKNARVLLIEYSDFQCPYCSRFHPTAQQVVDEYEGQVAWVYRHFPLDQMHPLARPTAEISECVGNLGGNDAFWIYTDALYENQSTLTTDNIVSFAQEAGVDVAAVQTCLDNGDFADYVQNDQDSGSKAGVTGTPGNILLDTESGESRLIPGAVPFNTLKTQIDEMLNEE